MNTHSDKKTESQNLSIHSKEKDSSTTSLHLSDHRPEANQTKRLQNIMNNSPQVVQQKSIQQMMNNSPLVLQQKAIQDKINQGVSNSPVQLHQADHLSTNNTPQNDNKTGLSDNLKGGIENLSGISMDDVKVHYNSAKPAQLNAHAYAQGTDIHVAPGQEKHLPHEAWHVIQQKQGRVQPTMQMKNKVGINDNEELEQEADVMGMKAVQLSSTNSQLIQKKKKTTNQNVVQRNESSTKVLSELAAPKVGQQDIDLAVGIQTDLDHIYDNVMKVDQMKTIDKTNYNSAVCLGGIILPPMKGFKEVGELIKSCEFVNLGKGSVNRGIYELLGGDLKARIVANTLLTMSMAGQLDYLKESDFASEEDSGWKVVVEIHYYRERPTANNVFHKDTLGTTLFVNLNYLNKEKMVGPEFLVNPADNPTHMSQLAENLPEEFLQDRAEVMKHLDKPRIIEVVEVPKYGYVAFVDETINHSSPTTEHRKVKGSQIHKFLKDKDKTKYDTYKAAYDKYNKRWTNLWSYDSYLPEGGGFDGQDWLAVFEHIIDGDNKYDRNQIREIEPEKRVFSDDEIDQMIHIGGHDGFGKVSIPGTGARSNMTSDDRPLKRRMSMNLDQDHGMAMNKESGGKRSFFRTWVRAEKVSTDVLRPDWKWDQKK